MCAPKIDKSMSKLLDNSPWEIEIISPAFFVFAYGNQHRFILFVDLLLITALYPLYLSLCLMAFCSRGLSIKYIRLNNSNIWSQPSPLYTFQQKDDVTKPTVVPCRFNHPSPPPPYLHMYFRWPSNRILPSKVSSEITWPTKTHF